MNIKNKIKEYGLTVTELAKKIGIAQTSLSTIINSKNPQFESLKKIADAIGISVSELVSDSDDKKPATIICPHCGKMIALEAKKELTSQAE